MNFEKPIKNLTEEELLNGLNVFSPGWAELAMGELARRSMKDLKESIDKLDKSTGIYSKAISVLTVLLIIIAIEQLFITIFPPRGIWILVYVIPDFLLLGMAVWLGIKILDVGRAESYTDPKGTSEL